MEFEKFALMAYETAYRADDHPSTSAQFHKRTSDQEISFSAVGAHHQNGRAEWNRMKPSPAGHGQ
jgi:hypothetical protein